MCIGIKANGCFVHTQSEFWEKFQTDDVSQNTFDREFSFEFNNTQHGQIAMKLP